MSIQDLRREARKLQRRANNKVSRLESKGVRVRHSEFDPRIDLKRVDRYNTKQLESYMNRLRSFNSRSSSFVASDSGKPIPGAMWREYRALEAKHNARVQERLDRFSDVHIPEYGKTVAEREVDLTPSSGKRRMRSPQARPLNKVSRRPENINGVDGMKKLIRDMRKRSTAKYVPDTLKFQRYNALQMMDRIGDQSLKKKVRSLTNEQFDLLWNYTGFANDSGQTYETITKTGVKQGQDVSDMEQVQGLHEQVNWALGQKVNNGSRSRNNYKRR